MTRGVLYISYDGMLEPLGQSQVLAYLNHLVSSQRIHIISFEKLADWENVAARTRLAQSISTVGIHWHPLRYHKRPMAMATAWDIVCGTSLGLWLVLRYRLNIVHARSYVPSIMALVLKWLTGIKYLFDMRGFWADEKVDGGSWTRSGLLYRLTKWFERRFFLTADYVVSLTNVGMQEIKRYDYLQGSMLKITVIPTCVDLARFTPLPRELCDNSVGGFVLGYVGSVGTFYLFDEVVTCFANLLRIRPEAFFLIVNRGQHDYIRERLAAAEVPASAYELTSATHSEVADKMARMDAGIFFIKPTFSKKASAPTKLAEFLGCGIPCLSNSGVGDMADVLEGDKVGVALAAFDDISLKKGLERLLSLISDPTTPARCVAAAKRHFSLDEGVARYQIIYDQLLG